MTLKPSPFSAPQASPGSVTGLGGRTVYTSPVNTAPSISPLKPNSEGDRTLSNLRRVDTTYSKGHSVAPEAAQPLPTGYVPRSASKGNMTTVDHRPQSKPTPHPIPSNSPPTVPTPVPVVMTRSSERRPTSHAPSSKYHPPVVKQIRTVLRTTKIDPSSADPASSFIRSGALHRNGTQHIRGVQRPELPVERVLSSQDESLLSRNHPTLEPSNSRRPPLVPSTPEPALNHSRPFGGTVASAASRSRHDSNHNSLSGVVRSSPSFTNKQRSNAPSVGGQLEGNSRLGQSVTNSPTYFAQSSIELPIYSNQNDAPIQRQYERQSDAPIQRQYERQSDAPIQRQYERQSDAPIQRQYERQSDAPIQRQYERQSDGSYELLPSTMTKPDLVGVATDVQSQPYKEFESPRWPQRPASHLSHMCASPLTNAPASTLVQEKVPSPPSHHHERSCYSTLGSQDTIKTDLMMMSEISEAPSMRPTYLGDSQQRRFQEGDGSYVRMPQEVDRSTMMERTRLEEERRHGREEAQAREKQRQDKLLREQEVRVQAMQEELRQAAEKENIMRRQFEVEQQEREKQLRAAFVLEQEEAERKLKSQFKIEHERKERELRLQFEQDPSMKPSSDWHRSDRHPNGSPTSSPDTSDSDPILIRETQRSQNPSRVSLPPASGSPSDYETTKKPMVKRLSQDYSSCNNLRDLHTFPPKPSYSQSIDEVRLGRMIGLNNISDSETVSIPIIQKSTSQLRLRSVSSEVVSCASMDAKKKERIEVGDVTTTRCPETGRTTKRTVLSRVVLNKKVLRMDKHGKMVDEGDATAITETGLTKPGHSRVDAWSIYPSLIPEPVAGMFEDDEVLGTRMYLDDDQIAEVAASCEIEFIDPTIVVDREQAKSGFDTAIKDLVVIVNDNEFKRSKPNYALPCYPGGVPVERPADQLLNCRFVTPEGTLLMDAMNQLYIETPPPTKEERHYSLPLSKAIDIASSKRVDPPIVPEQDTRMSVSFMDLPPGNRVIIQSRSGGEAHRQNTLCSVKSVRDRLMLSSYESSTESMLYDEPTSIDDSQYREVTQERLTLNSIGPIRSNPLSPNSNSS